jgi:hypothetical protein
LIDSFADVGDGVVLRNTSLETAPLVAGALVPIKVQYYQALGSATVALYWALPSDPATFSIVESDYLYHKNNTEAITAVTMILDTLYTSQMPTDLF